MGEIRAILRTKRQPRRQPNNCVEDLRQIRRRLLAEEWDGAEVIVRKHEEPYPHYSLIGWDENDCEIDRKVKEAIWTMEQDPFVGTYTGDRERFDHDWREGKYEPAAGITFEVEEVDELTETPRERFMRLMLKHPDLKVIPMVDAELCADAEGRWAGSIGKSRIDEYLAGKGDDNGIIYRENASELVDRLSEEAGYGREYEAARQQAWEKVNKMEWKKALFVEINLPEDI